MTTSGTTAFSLDLAEIVEEAFERCGSEVRSGYDLRTARRSLNLLFADWANRGLNLWTYEQGSIPLLKGVATYDLPEDTVDLLEHVLRTNEGIPSSQFDLSLNRVSVSTYSTIPNKLTQARPNQIFIDRQQPLPKITLWPVPERDLYYTLYYWRLRRMQDAGSGANTQDIPFRFLPALVAGLAYQLAHKLPGGMERIEMLKMSYDEAWQLASDEDREKSSISIVPMIAHI